MVLAGRKSEAHTSTWPDATKDSDAILLPTLARLIELRLAPRTPLAMNTAYIETMIAEKCGEPDAESDISELLGGVADSQGREVTTQDLKRGAKFVCRYVELVPYMMKSTLR